MNLRQDLRYGLRLMRRSPGFTLVVVLCLALGIGANTALFSIVDALILRTLPVREPDQLVAFTYSDSLLNEQNEDFSYLWYKQLRNGPAAATLSDIVAVKQIWRSDVSVAGSAATGDVLIGLISGNYFAMLGVNARMGRTLAPDDEGADGGNPVVVISDRFWQMRFNSAPGVIGRAITVNGAPFTVVGVMPRTFTGDWVGRPTDLWVPVTMEPQVTPERPDSLVNPNTTWLRIIGRRKAGATIAQAEAAARVGWVQSIQALKAAGGSHSRIEQFTRSLVHLQPYASGYAPERRVFKGPLAILIATVGLVLLIACANIASLLLVRSTVRQQEIATRVALGAARARIVQQLLAEGLLLAATGGTLGLVVADLATAMLMRMMAALPQSANLGSLALELDIHLSARMLLLTMSLVILTTLAFGLIPALLASKVSLTSAFGIRRDLGRSRRHVRVGKALVIAQVAISLLLLVGAGLFVRTLWNLKSQDLGFDRKFVLLLWTMPGLSGRTGPQLANYYKMAQDRASVVPGVLSASPSMNGLLHGASPTVRVRVPGLAPDDSDSPHFDLVTPGFFATVGMRLMDGRDFTERDAETAPHVAIVNQFTARLYFSDQNPIGKTFGAAMMSGEAQFVETEIVGVVNDTKGNFTLRETDRRMIYFPYRQDLGLNTHPRLTRMCLAVRTAGDPTLVKTALRDELRRMDATLPVIGIDSVEQQLDESIAVERMVAALSSFFGALALSLACLGLYGVISYSVARRTREIGVRLALGALPGNVLAMVLRETVAMVLVGTALAIPFAFALMRLLSSQLFGISPTDGLTTVASALLMVGVAALAGFLPARKASRIDPMEALRYE